MSFPGLKKAQDRADVIAYLKTVLRVTGIAPGRPERRVRALSQGLLIACDASVGAIGCTVVGAARRPALLATERLEEEG